MGPMKEIKRRRSLSHWTNGGLRSLAFVAAFTALTAAAACGGDSPSAPATPTPSKTPDGSYNISTVNGKVLPVAIFADTNYTYEVMSGSLVLTTDGKYSIMTKFRQTIPGNVSIFPDSTGGTWVLSGTSITFTNSDDKSTDTATWANNQLTFTETDGKATTTYVYSRK
jgi:hypothetical protein